MNLHLREGFKTSLSLADASRPVASPIHDPTGTHSLRRSFAADMDRRWAKVKATVRASIDKQDPLIHVAHADRVRAFNDWLDDTMRQIVLSGGAWMAPYFWKAGQMARARAGKLATSANSAKDAELIDAEPSDREAAIASLAVTELQGICDATAQQATRAFAIGGPATKAKTAKAVTDVIDKVGKTRSRMLVNALTIKAFGTATIDAFRAAGIGKVDTIPERHRKVGGISDGGHNLHRNTQMRANARPAYLRDQPDDDDDDRTEALEESLGEGALIEVLTAGDDDVCELCQDISDEGPYDLDEAEALIPAHPNCRCAFVPADDARFASVHDASSNSAPGAGNTPDLIPWLEGSAKAAAGVLFLTPGGEGLFLRRTGGDHSGEWSIPAGGLEGLETPEEAVQRESAEETGQPADKRALTHVDTSLTVRPQGQVFEFHTFLASVPGRFEPILNDEHDAFTWRPLEHPPSPLHPGLARSLRNLRRMVKNGPNSASVPEVPPGFSEIQQDHVGSSGASPGEPPWPADAESNPLAGLGDDPEPIGTRKTAIGTNFLTGDYDPNEPRDPQGKWTTGGGAGGEAGGSKPGKIQAPMPGAAGGLKSDDLVKIGPQKGSNEGGVFSEGPNYPKFYVKTLASPEHAANELRAARLYQLAGVRTFEYHPIDDPKMVATKFEKLDKDNVSQLTPAERTAAQRDFAVHAWLANRDAAGLGGDNQGVLHGKVTTLDVGGSLEYRAQGTPKGGAFGNEVTEFVSMRDPNVNKDAAALYGDMTNEQVVKSAARVTSLTDDQIRDAVGVGKGAKELSDKLIARRDDIAKGVKFLTESVAPTTITPAKFTPTAGMSKKEIIAGLLQQKGGTTTVEILKATGWPSVSVPAQAKAAGLKLTKTYKQGEYHYTAEKMTPEETKAAKSAAKEAKAAKVSAAVASLTGASAIETAEAKIKAGIKSNKMTSTIVKNLTPEELTAVQQTHGSVAKAQGYLLQFMGKPQALTPGEKVLSGPLAPKATATELQQAEGVMKHHIKAGVALGQITPQLTEGEKAALQGKYGTIAAAHTVLAGHAEQLTAEETKAKSVAAAVFGNLDPQEVKAFNEKYTGAATPKTKAGLAEKVAAFNALKQKNLDVYAAKQAEFKAQQEAAAKAAAEANAKYMTELGISQQQATAFGALVKMKGGGGADLAQKFHVYENEAKTYGYPISGFEAALIKDYTDGGYSAINEALRKGAWTPEQHVYAKVLNKALDGMPKFTGDVKRHASLSPEDQALYEPGKVVEERAFTSTSTTPGHGEGSQTEYFITAIGKRGSNVKKLSEYGNENEVLFKARTFFRVDKVEGTSSNKRVYMTELDD